MPTSAPQPAAPATLRAIALSAIVPIDGFNPRMGFDDDELQALSVSMLERGCLVPIIVQDNGDGSYRLVDGEKRYKAAAIAALMQLPAIVRGAGPGEQDARDVEGELLVDAMVVNQFRSQLTPLEEALAYRRLRTEHGRTIKGIAQLRQIKQARVRERLQILELPEALWPRVSSAEIPLGAVPALVAVAKIAPGLAEVAVAMVLDLAHVYDGDPWTWRDVSTNTLGMVATGLHDESVEAPAGVFVSSRRYPLSMFTLDERHEKAATDLATLLGKNVDELQLRFDRDAIEYARKLKAAYTPDNGYVTLIVGQDVADTIAADNVTAALKTARADAKRRRAAAATTTMTMSGSSDTPASAGAGGAPEPVDEDAARELARQQRADAAAASERAANFNDELGAAITTAVARVKVDDRVVKILTAVNVAADLDQIAMRGARYGFPGWVTLETTKRTTKRRYIQDRAGAKTKATLYLAGAKSAGEIAGRTIALLMMAVYADENAVANSNRAFHSVTVESGLPWAQEVFELLDEIAGEKLPVALIEPVLQPRRAEHIKRRAAAAAKADAIATIAELQPRLGELSDVELGELERAGVLAYGEYTTRAYDLCAQVRERRSALAAATAVTEDDVDEVAADTEGCDSAGDPDTGAVAKAHAPAADVAVQGDVDRDNDQ